VPKHTEDRVDIKDKQLT